MMKIAKLILPLIFLTIGIAAGYLGFNIADVDNPVEIRYIQDYSQNDPSKYKNTLNLSDTDHTFPSNKLLLGENRFIVKFPYLPSNIHPDDLSKEIECRKKYLDAFESFILSVQKYASSDSLRLFFTYEPCIDLQESIKRYNDMPFHK